MTPRARFDDLRPGGESFELTEPSVTFVARSPAEVPAVLRAAEDAAAGGRWVAGFVTYEAAPGLDPSLPAVDWPVGHPLAGLPLAWFAAFDRRSPAEPPIIPGAAVPGAAVPGAAAAAGVWTPDRDEAWHAAAVAEVHEGIAAGDYYQLNLTARLTGEVADPDGLYLPLAAAQSGAYNALIATGEHTVISASPELFFTREGGAVVTRPMKGTATRGRWPDEDRARADALHRSPKEQAENVMIVDLLRNDLGRLAEVGSVEVPALFETERYPSVWQLTSTITARVSTAVDLAGIFAALFPSGSVTGAPKRSAMQAIARIEGRPRGVYCGAIGYLRPPSHTGLNRGSAGRPEARFSVAIRTVTRDEGSGYAEYGAGGGITASSTATGEWAELLAKTAILRHPPRPTELFETLRFEPPATLVNLNRHVARLGGSADYFGFRWDAAALQAAVDAAVDGVLRGRAEPARVRLRLDHFGKVAVDVVDLRPASAVVSLGLAGESVRSDDVLLFHKHRDRAHYDRLRAARPDVDDVVLWNERGEVTETTIANLAVRLDRRWWTPPLTAGLLPGIERGRLLDDGELAERVISVDEFADAEDLAVISSLRGWRRAKLRN
jgi:para-aminobenzoate synthetase / 4-amino-4-deoxychorismate lyase